MCAIALAAASAARAIVTLANITLANITLARCVLGKLRMQTIVSIGKMVSAGRHLKMACEPLCRCENRDPGSFAVLGSARPSSTFQAAKNRRDGRFFRARKATGRRESLPAVPVDSPDRPFRVK